MVVKINLETSDKDNEPVIHDVLYVLRDKKMYIPEKRMWLQAIDFLQQLGYYRSRCNDGEKASLFKGES